MRVLLFLSLVVYEWNTRRSPKSNAQRRRLIATIAAFAAVLRLLLLERPTTPMPRPVRRQDGLAQAVVQTLPGEPFQVCALEAFETSLAWK